MRDGPDKLRYRAWREHGVGIDSHHVTHVAKRIGVAYMDRECGPIAFHYQAIELLQLPALALPCHPARFRRIVVAGSQKQVERSATLRFAMPAVEVQDRLFERIGNGRIAFHFLFGRVGQIGEESYMDPRVDIREPMRFELL